MSKRRRKKRLPEPVSDVTIESLGHDGRGVTHLDGKAVFIDGALPGEVVSFEYLSSRRKFDEGRVTGVIKASPDRVEPKCPHFGLCGGCSLQHMEAGAQIKAKQQVLLDNLKHIGKVVPEAVLPPLTGAVWGYRTKGRLGVKDVIKKGRVLVGFREKRSPYVADLTRCEVLHPSVGEHLGDLSELIERLEAKARIPQIEIAVTSAATALLFRHLDPLSEADIETLQQFAVDLQFHVYLQPGGPDTVQPLWPQQSVLSYQLPAESIEIRFRPTDFTQVNTGINEQMIARVLELLALEQSDAVLDLFCGLGNFTLPMARHAGTVTGVEGEAGLVSRARDNAILNDIGNAIFYTANLAEDSTEAQWAGGGYNKVLLDPPRSGAAEVMDVLGNIGPQRIVYVSCHPGSLARDAGTLVNEKGYRLLSAGVMDMFPHTAHVESIALFESG
ncbi:MAG TPA: 23S rRNA (uracil(1939)-C(5))-methyltransferase RlmD [Gammaproteobacteria bacterium]|nr:23S rRNA (uracil(1939)-C(5))-methyltransferase RlmD [Gammaproteobacteria bacterium]